MKELIWKQDALFSLMEVRKHLLAKGQKGAEHILTHYAYNVIDELPLAQLDFDTTVKIDKAYDDGFKAGYAQAKADYLPPVQPKHGKWHIENNSCVVLDVCDQCMRSVRHVAPFYDFCPHCGADMRGEQNDSD